MILLCIEPIAKRRKRKAKGASLSASPLFKTVGLNQLV
jgi:hypothetical protein